VCFFTRVSGDHKIALVPQVSGKKDVRSDLTGDRSTSDVGCECRVPQAYDVLCLHNVSHAHAVGIEPHDRFHVKDRAETWKAEYPDSLEYPMLSDSHSLVVCSVTTNNSPYIEEWGVQSSPPLRWAINTHRKT